MNFQNKSSKLALLVMWGLLITGVGKYGIAFSVEGEPAKAQAVQPVLNSVDPVLDCHESRENGTAVDRVEGVVPQYGHPNVKCSKKTGIVLWYGDPYDGTIPMGEMPAFNDDTKVDFANAVVKPREPQLMYFNMDPDKHCAACHDGKTVPFPKDKKPRLLAMHQDVVEDSLQLQHGRGAIWCLDCHSAKNRNKLIDHQSSEISFNQPQKLCGKCHGEAYIDWRRGIHGKRSGAWAVGGKKRWWVCTECHNPHTVQKHRFDPIAPQPAPALPRGMKNANHERGGHDAH